MQGIATIRRYLQDSFTKLYKIDLFSLKSLILSSLTHMARRAGWPATNVLITSCFNSYVRCC